MKISQNEERKTVCKKRRLVYWGKKEDKGGGAIPIGPLASITAPILREMAKPILGKIFARGKKRRRKELR